MKVMMRRISLAVFFVGLIGVAQAQVQVWELPKGAKAGSRDGWKAAEKSGAFANGVAVENGKILLFAAPDSAGPTLTAVGDAGVSTELQIVGGKNESGKVEKVNVTKRDEGEVVVQLGAGSQEVAVRMTMGKAFVEVTPLKGAAALDVKGKTRYVVLPDFFGNDVVFDPARYKSERLTAPAENFLLNMLDGGNGIVMCVWQGTLSPSKKDEKPGAEAKEPRVDVFFAGQGKERFADKSRIEFAGKPVFVALLAGKGIWFDLDVSAEPAQKTLALDWKRPFEAKWRVDFLNREGAFCGDLMSGIVSWDAWYTAESAGRADEKGNPTMSMQGLWPYFRVPAWVKNGAQADGKFYVSMYADMGFRKDADSRNEKLKAEARKENKPFVQFYPTNVFERIVVYPVDRRKETPLTEVTPTDIMRDSLGQGPCGYVLDLEGLSGMKGGGTREALATCGTYDEYISKFITITKGSDEWVNVNGKKKKITGLKAGEKLQPEDEAFLVEKLEDLSLFVTAVNGRLKQYRKFYDETVEYCNEQAKKNPQVKPVAEKLQKQMSGLGQRLSEQKMKDFENEKVKWDGIVKKVIEEVKAGNYAGISRSGGIRDELALPQDILVAFCRKAVKGIRQEASLSDASEPEVLTFTTKIRNMSHAALRNKHQMEGW